MVVTTATNTYGTVTQDSGVVGPVAAGAPVNTVAPKVTGAVARGAVLSVTAGTWSPVGTKYTYVWELGSGSSWTPITGATGSTFTPVLADESRDLMVVVTATNAYGTATQDSGVVGPVADGAPENTVAPKVTGTVARGAVLSVTAGTWSPAGTKYTYVWELGSGSSWTSITGATGSTFTPALADETQDLRVVVTATNTYGTATVDSNVVGPVAAGASVKTSGDRPAARQRRSGDRHKHATRLA
jgi:hypothetical protein